MFKKLFIVFTLTILMMVSCIPAIAETISKLDKNQDALVISNDDFEYMDPEWFDLWTLNNPPQNIFYCGYDVAIDEKNNLIYVAGLNYNMMDANHSYVLQYDMEGNLKESKYWEKYFQFNSPHEQCNAICVYDGYLYVARANPNTGNLIVEKYDKTFSQPLWKKSYDNIGEPSRMEYYENNLYIFGMVRPHADNVYFVKISENNGDLKWSNSLKHTNARLASFITPIGDYIYLCGTQRDDGDGYFNIYLKKYHVDGNLINEIVLDNNDWENAFSMAYDGENLIVFANVGFSSTHVEIAMVRFNKKLEQIGSPKPILDISDSDWGNSAIIHKNNIYIVGTKFTGEGNNLYKKITFLAKYSLDGDMALYKVWASNPQRDPFSSAHGIAASENNLYIAGMDSSTYIENYGSSFLLKCDLEGSHSRKHIASRFTNLHSFFLWLKGLVDFNSK